MKIFRRLAERRRTRWRYATDDTPYVCTLCGAGYENRAVIVCPECRGFVVPRED